MLFAAIDARLFAHVHNGAVTEQALVEATGLRTIDVNSVLATVLDLPPVVVATNEYIDDAGVSDRVDTVGADFTVGEFPGPVDVVVMASNLPIYEGDVIAGVVARSFRALEPGGEMQLIGEMLTDDRTGPVDAAMWGMNELICGSLGRSHTAGECAGCFEAVGFTNVEVTEFVPGVLSRCVGIKPPAAG